MTHDAPPEVALGALSAEEFEAALRAREAGYWHQHPFEQALQSGNLSRAHLQTWISNRYHYQQLLPQKDAAILSNCPDADVRREWIKRITYHDGARPGTGGLVQWIQLGEAVGLTQQEMIAETLVTPGVRFAADAYLTFARTQPWIDGVAASLTELFAPGLMQARIRAFQAHYPWIPPAGYKYFTARTAQAQTERDYALALVLRICTTRDLQDRAVAALEFKCDVLWAMMDAIYHACELE